MDSKTAGEVERILVLVWRDLQTPHVLWELVLVALAVGLGWWLARAIQQRLRPPPADRTAIAVGVMGGLKAVLWPLIAFAILIAARPVLARWYPVNLVSLAIALLGSLVLVRAAVYVLRSAFPLSSLLAVFEKTIAFGVWAVFALHITGFLPEVNEFFDGITLSLGKQSISLLTVARGLFWVFVIVLVSIWIGAAIDRRLMRAESLHSSLRVAFSRLIRAVLVFVGVLIALPLVGIDLTVLSVFGGALGVGIGFGLQKIASNYMSGFIILLERSVRLGDMVTVDNFHGEVKAITTRYVVVRALDGREAIIPNEKLITDTVLNHSFSDRQVRHTVQVQIGYRSDLERALRLIEEIAARHPSVLAEPQPVALVAGFADSGITIECGFWIRDPKAGPALVRSDINRSIFREFATAGIEIPYPQREIRIIDGNLGRNS